MKSNSKKKSIVKFLGVGMFLVIGSLLFVVNTIDLVKQCNDNNLSFTDVLFSMPLEVRWHLSIQGRQIKLINMSTFNWENVTISLNQEGLSSGYVFNYPSVKKGETIMINISDFVNVEGTRFNIETTKIMRCTVAVRDPIGRMGKTSGAVNYYEHPN